MDLSYILFPALSLGSMGILFGLVLGYAGVKFKVEQDERVPLVRDALPGANCGGCGFAGCDALAEAIVEGRAKVTSCPVGGAACAESIGGIMGIVPEISERQTAFVKCSGGCSKSTFRYEYRGMEDCKAAMQLTAGGARNCAYGCLGSGSCVRACQFDAISIVDGVALVDQEKCTACGMCATACPKNLIGLTPYKNRVRVACNSQDNGKTVRANCTVGCIGCKLCEKACQVQAIKVDNFLAKIDYALCNECGDCAAKCPTKAIMMK